MSNDSESATLNDTDWKSLLSSIQQGRCILFVGPDTVLKEPGVLYHQGLIQSDAIKNDNSFSYTTRDEMFLLKKKAARWNLVSAFRDYCSNNKFYEETYKKIAAIPFQTIILMSRYAFLPKYFKDNNYALQERWFSKTRNISPAIDDLTADTPLVYNIFGKWDEDDSLLLTYDDLFAYLSNLLGKTKTIDPKLKDIVQNSSQIIFLGFRFERWYIQLLLRLFELDKRDADFTKTATFTTDDADTKEICETDFQLNFIGDNIESFIDVLYDKCVSANIKLRTPSVATTSSLQDVFNDFLVKNNFDMALKKLAELEAKNNLQDQRSINLRGRWNALMDDKDSISPNDYITMQNSLRKDIGAAFQQALDNN